MAKHGVFVTEKNGTAITPIVAESGIPFVIGTSPVQSAENPANAGAVVLCSTYEEAVEKLGYSDDWDNYTLCEVMYSHFKMFGCSPVIFCNILDISTHKEAVSETEYTVADHKVKLSIDAINDSALVVKSGSYTLVKDTDYKAFYGEEELVVELISTSTYYSASTLKIAYNKAKASAVTNTEVANGLENIELCLTALGVVPDLILAPKYSTNSSVAAAMSTKADAINGMFKAKAIVDIDCSSATTPDLGITKKTTDLLVDEAEIVCWPMAKSADKVFHLSTIIAGAIAEVDTENDGCPYESPSNKAVKISALVIPSGGDYEEVQLTLAKANQLNQAGIVTAINFVNGWTVWGNYTACFPSTEEVKDYFIPVSRMFGWVGNSLIKTFWGQLDKPMSRRLIDTILDTANVWLNGLVGQGYLLGARVEMLDSENPLANFMAGIIKLHVYITPPSPAQEIDFVLEYDASYVESSLS